MKTLRRLKRIFVMHMALVDLIGRKEMERWCDQTEPTVRKGRTLRERLVIGEALLTRKLAEERSR